MSDPTFIACPRCGEPFPMSAMQKRLFIGRTLSCNRCAKPFSITEETPDPVPARVMRGNSPIPQSLMYPPPPPPAAGDSLNALASAAETGPTQTAPAAPPTARPSDGLTAGRMAMLIAVVMVAVGFLLYLAISPSVHRAREAARRSTCASNLIQIGLALQRYTSNNGGRFPESLEVLVLDGTLPAELLVCPSSKDTVAPGASPGEQAASLAKGGHESYGYLGKDMRMGPGKRAVAYERLDHHENEGANVLYSDGSVQFLTRSAALIAIPQLAAPSSNPSPTTAPAAGRP
jgi:prepilin-type processing-associated H-X9-DG protein